MTQPLFTTVRRGATLRFSETLSGDPAQLNAAPTGWLIAADTSDLDNPAPGATQIPLTVTVDADPHTHFFTLLDTSGLTQPRYLFFSRYVLTDLSVEIAEPTLVVVR